MPPSVVLVLYAMIARRPVGQLWLWRATGADDGDALHHLYLCALPLSAKPGPVLPAEERNVSLAEKLRLPRAGLPPLVIFAVMMVPFVGAGRPWSKFGGRRDGHAAGGYLKGRMTRQVFEVSVRKTLAISCMFMWIILAALAFGAIFDGWEREGHRGPVYRASGALALDDSDPQQLSFIVMGTFLDDTAMLVIVAPLYVPLVEALGFDLIWYSVLYTITTQIAYMTPPFSYNLFLMLPWRPEIGLRDIYLSILPFVAVMMAALSLVMVFPQIALWLRATFMGLTAA